MFLIHLVFGLIHMIGLTVVFFLGGLGILLLSAEKLVSTASRMARLWGVSDFVIGLSVLAIGTSVPEIATAIVSGLHGTPEIGWGTLVGSSLSVMALALSVGVLSKGDFTIKREYFSNYLLPMLILSFIFGVYSLQSNFTRLIGLVLLLIFAGYLLVLGRVVKQFSEYWNIAYLLEIDKKIRIPTLLPRKIEQKSIVDFASVVLALVGIWIGAETAVWSSTALVSDLGLAQSLIGLIFLALGASLPEIIVSFTTIRHKHNEAFFGNVVGSVITNIGLAGGLLVLIRPPTLSVSFVTIPVFFLFAMTLTIFLMAWKHQKISRVTSVFLLLLFAAYLLLVVTG